MVEELAVKSSKIVLDNSETYKFLSQAHFETYVHILHAGTFVCHYLCYIVILLLVSVKLIFWNIGCELVCVGPNKDD